MPKAPKKMTMAKWEKSKADAREDKRNAKKAGMSTKQWEGSPGDKKADRAAVKKINKSLPARPGKGSGGPQC